MKSFLIVAEVKKEGKALNAYDVNTGALIAEEIPEITKSRALRLDAYVVKTKSSTGELYWRRIPKGKIDVNMTKPVTNHLNKPIEKNPVNSVDEEIRKKISDAVSFKPDLLVIDDLNWRLATRAVLRGKKMFITGHSGCGKTMTAQSLAKAYNRPFFFFNMGAMQDARASLIGNTHYSPEKGTFFAGSEFVRAIQTPNAIVMLDELTRISPDAENILIPVLDSNQRYLRIDEDPNTPTIEVASGVVFIGTANVGAQYTATRVLDRATIDRWETLIELKVLNKEQEINLMKKMFPELNRNYVEAFADIAEYTRKNVTSDNPTLSTIISTRSIHEQCRLALDGFRFSEVMEALVFQLYSAEGGVEAERSEMMQKVQEKSHLDNESPIAFENVQKKQEVEELPVVDDEPIKKMRPFLTEEATI